MPASNSRHRLLPRLLATLLLAVAAPRPAAAEERVTVSAADAEAFTVSAMSVDPGGELKVSLSGLGRAQAALEMRAADVPQLPAAVARRPPSAAVPASQRSCAGLPATLCRPCHLQCCPACCPLAL